MFYKHSYLRTFIFSTSLENKRSFYFLVCKLGFKVFRHNAVLIVGDAC